MMFTNLLNPPEFDPTLFGWKEDFFNNDECKAILSSCGKLRLSEAKLGADAVNPNVRQSKVGWLARNEENKLIYEKLGAFAKAINERYYGFHLSGFSEDIQYAEYPANAGYFGWHIDIGKDKSHRKLSLIVLLSDTEDHEGGELSLMTSAKVRTVPKKKGTLVFFPSYILHQVSPVTSGLRKSLSLWVSGDHLK